MDGFKRDREALFCVGQYFVPFGDGDDERGDGLSDVFLLYAARADRAPVNDSRPYPSGLIRSAQP